MPAETNKPINLDPSIDQYRKIRPYYEEFCDRLKTLLEDLLSKASINYHVIEERAKSIESFAEKLQREGKIYNEPLR